MNNRNYIFINGILTNPDDIKGWTDRAESWVLDNTTYNAERYEYFADAVFRRLWQANRVEKIATLVSRIHNDGLYLVGHSNGCDLIERFLRQTTRRIEEIHLIAAASEQDFRKNGLNYALERNKVGKIFVYWSKQDKVLEFASRVTPWISWLGLGYGYLGFNGPQNVHPSVKDRVIAREYHLNHCDYFSEVQLDDTLRTITGVNV